MTTWPVPLAALGFLGVVTGAEAPEAAFSIFLNVTGWYPFMVNTDTWNMDLATGAITSNENTWTYFNRNGSRNVLKMIGTRYEPFGTVEDLAPGLERQLGQISYIYKRGNVSGASWARLLQPFPVVGALANPVSIQLGSYPVRLLPMANTTVTISYAIIEVPIITRAYVWCIKQGDASY